MRGDTIANMMKALYHISDIAVLSIFGHFWLNYDSIEMTEVTVNFDPTFDGRIKLPLIVAPMFLVSNPSLTLAAASQGVIGSFPAHATRTREIFKDWLDDMQAGLAELDNPPPYAVNLVVHPTNERMPGDLELCERYKVPIVLTSKGAPKDTFSRIHDWGGLAFHDVSSARHSEKAVEAGADALIAVCGGAGGHCGTINPFALVNEIREVTDKPIILAGGMSTGQDILAAQAMGATYVYMGTRFIACNESMADTRYAQTLIECTSKDIFFSAALDGAPANWVTPSLIEAGVDLEELATTIPGEVMPSGKVAERYSKVLSAGHGVGMVKRIESAVDLCAHLKSEYDTAKTAMLA
ncbi:MAG: nitronate monooxygenase [Parvularculales bacterium]